VGGVATAIPFVSTFQPSEKAKAAGAAVEVDISALKVGEKMTVEWRGKPVWILKRTPEQLANSPSSTASSPTRCPSAPRRIHPQVRAERSTARSSPTCWSRRHLHPPGLLAQRPLQPGPQPSLPDDWEGGFLCPCHGSTFDLAGRVFKNKPAPDNLPKCRRTCTCRTPSS
jgi:ubiquinol-cytochrome c reductase iron-sulfur subunit